MNGRSRFGIIGLVLTGLCLIFTSCGKDDSESHQYASQWQRSSNNPVFRDLIPTENYQTASDAHVFLDESNQLRMIYTGDVAGRSAVKLANGSDIMTWQQAQPLVFDSVSSGLDKSKETPFYYKTSSGKHQVYYIGYDDESTYQAQIFLAESDALEGPYIQLPDPVVPRGLIAGHEVYCITSPSVVSHAGQMYIMFIGWDADPSQVTEVWILGATSTDEGHTWTDFQEVETRIGMEGQVTKTPSGSFIAVRTGTYEDDEAIFYATANHPFGPWTEEAIPILIREDPVLEKDEVIAPQIYIDLTTEDEYLYYTGADYSKGWWIMLASPN